MNDSIDIFTIGFTKKTAREFFTMLREVGIRRVVDVRLNNVSQLAGFTKKDDLEFFLKEVLGVEYVHAPDLAPTQAMLDALKKQKGQWSSYETDFLKLMESRHAEALISREMMDGACLLCSEANAVHCHRRLVAEYLQRRWGDVVVHHLE